MTDDQWWPEQEPEPFVRPMFHAARRYLWLGWYPIPVARATKKPTLGNWPIAAKNLTYEGVEALWDRDDPPNIGLVTGILYDVLDVDGLEGKRSIERYLNGRPWQPTGPVSATGGGGRHIFFRATGYAGAGALLPNVDFRGVAGQVVAPPSIHESGKEYRWTKGHSWEDFPLPDAPEWLLELLESKKAPEPVETAVSGSTYDHGSVESALSSSDIPYRHEGSLIVFQCQTGRHGDSEWSAKTGLGEIADRKWMCFGCGAWGDAENIASGTHVLNSKRYHNLTLSL